MKPTAPLTLRAMAPVALIVALCPSITGSAADDEKEKTLRFWLENMAWHHDYTVDEMASALDVEPPRVRELLERFGIDPAKKPAEKKRETIKVLPYPGGRHPRIGFLDGAVDPHRDTKVSVFPPWSKSGYIVVDFPEALWSQHGLVYLAHTHIPTVWDKKGIKLERQDWKRKKDGLLESRRVLPNKLEFTARVLPRKESVDMELRLENGTDERFTDLRTQICVLLKGAPQLNDLTNDNKKIVGPAVAVRARDAARWVVTAWDRARPWNNERCPCMHSDPVFPDLDPGKKATVRGRIFFYEGDDIEAEIERRRVAGTLIPGARPAPGR